MFSITEDSLLEILRYVDPCELLQNRSLNKDLRDVISDRRFLRTIAEDRGLPYSESLNDLCKYSQMRDISLLGYCSEKGDLRVVKWLIENRKFSKLNYDWAMSNAAHGGHIEIVKMMLNLGADDYDWAMSNAAHGGHIEIVKMMLELGADDYNSVMSNAAIGGHIEIVKMMLELGAVDYTRAMASAARGGQIEIVKLMLKFGADDYNRAMAGAAHGGQIEIVKLMLKLGADDYNRAMAGAAHGGNMEIIKLIQSFQKNLKKL